MMLSVIIPSYNSNRYVGTAVASILSSCQFIYDIKVIDDGSIESPLEFIPGFHSPIQLITKQNGGCASARMHGFRATSSDFVCFVDADDWVEPTYVDDLVNACIAHDTPVSMCYHTERYEVSQTAKPAFPHSFLLGACTPASPVIPATETLLWKPAIWAAVYRRDFLLRHGIEFPEHIRMFDDLAFHAQIAFSGANIAIVPKHLYNYRLQRPGQDTSNRGKKLFVHFDIFGYLDRKLAADAVASEAYFLLKYQTHRWTSSIIDPVLRDAYRVRAAFDLFSTLSLPTALKRCRALHRIKRRFGRDALALLALQRRVSTSALPSRPLFYGR